VILEEAGSPAGEGKGEGRRPPPLPPRHVRIHRSRRDLPVLACFVGIWCEGHHGDREREPWSPPQRLREVFDEPLPELCFECGATLAYAVGRRVACPYDPKPACKHCPTPCYREEQRERMRAIMRYSGWRLILRGHWSLLWKYFL